jgi:hypothetical protein
VTVNGGGLPDEARCDAPVLYLGWHQPNMGGPFSLPGFRFPPGAIALHIHSFSAWTMRSSRAGWCGPLVAGGVAATVGNVYEPYLEFLHRPDMLLRALARGKTLGEAAYYALPVLSWQSVVIGDPLYRPFSIALRDELRGIDRLPARLAGYPVLRLMRLLDSEGRRGEALGAARAALEVRPGMLPLELEVARRLDEAGRRPEAVRALGAFALREAFAPDEWALAREAAGLLLAWGSPVPACEVYAILLKGGAPAPVRRSWLEAAAQAAESAGKREQAAALRREADSLAPDQRPVTIRSASP